MPERVEELQIADDQTSITRKSAQPFIQQPAGNDGSLNKLFDASVVIPTIPYT